ncbi:hypothetical protein D3C80_1130370 [compost metagenome]
MVNLHPAGEGLADLLDVIDGDMSQSAASEETLPLASKLLIPKVCHHGVIAHGPQVGLVQQTPLHAGVLSQGLVVTKRQQRILGRPVTAADEVGKPAAKQRHQI